MIFSIITSVYNNKEMIPCALDAVASQQNSHVTIEHILVDGNSKDGTKEYLEGLTWPHLSFKSEKDNGIYCEHYTSYTHRFKGMLVPIN